MVLNGGFLACTAPTPQWVSCKVLSPLSSFLMSKIKRCQLLDMQSTGVL